MNYEILDAQFIQVMDVSFMYEIQKNDEPVQQYKNACFFVAIKTDKGEGVFILRASCNKDKEFTKFLIEHERMQEKCCACSIPHDEADVYCHGFSQETLSKMFEEVQIHPRIKEIWEIEKEKL